MILMPNRMETILKIVFLNDIKIFLKSQFNYFSFLLLLTFDQANMECLNFEALIHLQRISLFLIKVYYMLPFCMSSNLNLMSASVFSAVSVQILFLPIFFQNKANSPAVWIILQPLLPALKPVSV